MNDHIETTMGHIVVTGATGFVGSALVEELVRRGATVTALVRPSSAYHSLVDLGVNLVQGDIIQPTTLTGLFDDADCVIHAAGMLGQAGVPEKIYYKIHVEGTRNILSELSRLPNPPRMLHVSSPGVLGPIVSSEPADEKAPHAPSNPYERSKATAEMVVREFVRHGLPIVIARPEFIYGPGDLHVLGLFQAVQRGLFFYVGRGTAVCHPTYIDDAVTGMLLALEQGNIGDIYHITGPTPVTFRELGDTIATTLKVRRPWLMIPRSLAWSGAWFLEKLAKQLNRTPPISRTGVAFFSEDRRFSREKAFKTFGYIPQFSLSQGVLETVNWYRAEGLLA